MPKGEGMKRLRRIRPAFLHDIVPVVSILVNQELEPEGCGIRQLAILASNPTGHESPNASSRCLVREYSSFPVILKAGYP